MDGFFGHLAALGAEHERLQAENSKLRRVLATCQGVDALGETLHSSLRQGSSPPGPPQLNPASLEEQPRDALALTWNKGELRVEPQHGAGPSDSEAALEEPQNSTPIHSVSAIDSDAKAALSKTRQGVFDIGDMKEKMKKELMKNAEETDVSRFYHKSGWSQSIARHLWFENTTLAIIVSYAIWMAIDTDHNSGSTLRDTPVVFVVANHIFCSYFTLELVIRFLAFKSKLNCIRDWWFVFDFILVTMMVAETWVLDFVVLSMDDTGSGGGMGDLPILRLLRLARLTRLLRMARLVRLIPELMILIKAIAAATRSVSFTMSLLMLLIYVFGIAFTSILKDTDVGQESFPTVLYSMHSLLMHGAFCDDITSVMAELIKESYIAVTLMYILILLAAVTVMNMLIGILCEVITAVADAERETIQLGFVKETLQRCLAAGVDEDNDGFIDQDEFLAMLQNQDAISALREIDVDVVSIYDYINILFEEGDDVRLPFVDFVDMLLKLRGGNVATVKDLVDLRKYLVTKLIDIEDVMKKPTICGAPPVPQDAPAPKVAPAPKDASIVNGEQKHKSNGDLTSLASQQTDIPHLLPGNPE